MNECYVMERNVTTVKLSLGKRPSFEINKLCSMCELEEVFNFQNLFPHLYNGENNNNNNGDNSIPAKVGWLKE